MVVVVVVARWYCGGRSGGGGVGDVDGDFGILKMCQKSKIVSNIYIII